MITGLAIARAAFARSRTLAEGLLTTAQVELKLDNARLEAQAKALATGAATPDVGAVEDNIVGALTPRRVDRQA